MEPQNLQSTIVFIILVLFSQGCAFFVTIEPHGQECFFDKAQQGTKMSLMFEVIEGGFLDIDVKISGPDGKSIYAGERESNGKYAFAAHMNGVYTYCFSNQMSSMTSKTVMFSMDVGDAPQESSDVHHNKLEDMIAGLSAGLSAIKHEQEYMEVRERVHRTINDSTNSRVVWWSVFEAFLIVCMTFGQVYYLKRFFEVRRVI